MDELYKNIVNKLFIDRIDLLIDLSDINILNDLYII